MRISTASGDFVELLVNGYEFPAASDDDDDDDDDDWDANWLVVSGDVRWLGESWSFSHPMLTTWDARALLAWLRDDPTHRAPSIEFTEPNLAFAVIPVTDGAAELVLTLSGEAAPPSLPESERWEGGRRLSFHLSPEVLVRSAEEWERDITAYPPR